MPFITPYRSIGADGTDAESTGGTEALVLMILMLAGSTGAESTGADSTDAESTGAECNTKIRPSSEKRTGIFAAFCISG